MILETLTNNQRSFCGSSQDLIPSIIRRDLELTGETLSNQVNLYTADIDVIAKRFYCLAKEWKNQTEGLSNISRRVTHRAYRQIISMGGQAIPFILQDFQRGVYEDWFWALSLITGENPIPPEASGNVKAMAQAWLQWGKKNHYLKD